MDYLANLFVFISSEYAIHLYILIGIYVILGQGFNLVFGVGQLFNLAHVAAYAVGAYTTAILSTELDVAAGWCILLSMATSGVLAFLLGGIALRLRHDYFAIGTLAFSAVINALLVNWKGLTRGVLGIPGIPRPELFGVSLEDSAAFLMLTWILAGATLVVVYVLFKSSFSRSLRAMAEFEQAALALGRNVQATRTLCFFIGSSLAGLAGSLFAYYINYIDPSSFSLTEMVFVLTIVVVGSPGSFLGTIATTVFLLLLPEGLRFVELSPSILGPMRQLLYALILFGVVLVYRNKLFPIERTI